MASSGEPDNSNLQQFNRFLQNNNDLLLDKYRQYFLIDSLPIKSVQPITVVKFISDIFSFDRYKDGSITEKIETSLKKNFTDFVKANKTVKQFSSKIAIKLLQFCIQNNQLFAVTYEKGQSKETNQPAKEVLNVQVQGGEKQNKEQASVVKGQVDSVEDSHRGGSNLTNQFADGNSREQLIKNNSFIQNQFDLRQDIKIDFDPILIKKNTAIVFDYYCKQQMALKPNLSFDRIEEQSTTLTLNKILLMARMMGMLNSVITKQLILSKFRLISQGKRRINFKKFSILMTQLQILDPSLVARSELNSPNIHTHLKTTKKPFDTQDVNPRELIKNRPFAKKLTMHSGKMEQDLVMQLCTRKSEILPQRSSRLKRYQEIVEETRLRHKHTDSDIINTKNFVSQSRKISSDLGVSIVKSIINQKDDQKYLKQYMLPHQKPPKVKAKNKSVEPKHERNETMIRQLKNRIKQLEKHEQQSSNNMEETRAYLKSPPSSRR